MRIFTHYRGSDSVLNVQLSARRASMFRSGASSGPLVFPNDSVAFAKGGGWYTVYGQEIEIRWVARMMISSVAAAEKQEAEEIRRLLMLELGIGHVVEGQTKHVRVPPRHTNKVRAPSQGALLALQRRLTRHVGL